MPLDSRSGCPVLPAGAGAGGLFGAMGAGGLPGQGFGGLPGMEGLGGGAFGAQPPGMDAMMQQMMSNPQVNNVLRFPAICVVCWWR